MSGPWDNYKGAAAAAAGPAAPWKNYQGAANASPDGVNWGKPGELVPIQIGDKDGQLQVRWATPQIVDQLLGAFTLPGDVLSGKTPLDPRVPYSQQDPATLDRAATLGSMVGGEASLASRNMVPAAAGDIAMANGARLHPLIRSELNAANIGGGAHGVAQALRDLGPGAVVGDLTPRLQARTGAVATMPGPGQDMIVQAMGERAGGANQRIRNVVQGTFGPEPVPSAVAAQIDQARVGANQLYEPALREHALGPAMGQHDAAPIIAAIDAQSGNFVGQTRARLQSIRRMLVDPATGQPTQDPQIILATRHELDGLIGEMRTNGQNRTTVSALGDLRSAIDQDLGNAIPGLKWADAAHAATAAQQEGFDLGRNALRASGTGDNVVHPQDLATGIHELSGPRGNAIGPRGPSMVPQRVSEGALSHIYQAIGVTANDRVALRSLLKGDGSWNREKMVTMFGQQRTDALIQLLDQEATKSATEQMAIGGSRTDVLRSAKVGIEPVQKGAGAIRSLANLKFGDAALAVGDRLTGGAARALAERRNRILAQALLSGADDLRAIPRPPPTVRQIGNGVLQQLIARSNQGGGGGGY